ncbi:unnamed protein product [Peniophora sp. CBMAI 1063]|nr:unnamed protein product [Peniophora sp. CBMAI 1063]
MQPLAPSSLKPRATNTMKGLQRGVTGALFAFGFHKATEEELAEQRARVAEQVHEARTALEARTAAEAEAKTEKHRQVNREHVRKHRDRKRQGEMKNGTRNATTRCKINPKKCSITETNLTVNDLRDESPPKEQKKAEIAELSRPECHTKARILKKLKSNVGPKPQREVKGAIYVNWHTPFLWRQIEAARKVAGWSSRGIQKELVRPNADIFGCISHNSIQAWFDLSNPLAPKWSESCIEMNKLGNHQAEGNKGGCRGVLSAYPEVTTFVNSWLQSLHAEGAPISLVTVRGIIVASILHMTSEIF